MSKLSSRVKNNRRKLIVKQYAPKRKEIKDKLKNTNGSKTTKEIQLLNKMLQKLPRDSNPIRVRNRCFSCDRPRANISRFGLCRICIIEYSTHGYIPGLTRSSW
jgi:small subunit ribosomal protein S14